MTASSVNRIARLEEMTELDDGTSNLHLPLRPPYTFGKNERNKEIWILRCLVWIKRNLLSLPLMNLRKRNNIGCPVERLTA